MTIAQRSPQWLEERRKGIGSSDAPIIAGVAPWGDTRELWAEKIGLDVPREESEPMRWGRILESAIAEGYTEITGNRLRKVNLVQRHRSHPWMLASIDRVIVGRRRILEIKTARFRGEGWGSPGTDEIPDHYNVQVQHQMAVTGFREADLAVLFSGSDLKLYTVQRDQALIDGLIDMELAFWTLVESKTPPSDTPPVPLLLREATEADERVTAMVAQLREDRARYAAAKASRDATEGALKAALEREQFVRGQGFSIIYRPSKDKTEIGWEQIATAYRGLIQDSSVDLDAIQSLYTRTKPGARPLLVRWEDSDAYARAG